MRVLSARRYIFASYVGRFLQIAERMFIDENPRNDMCVNSHIK